MAAFQRLKDMERRINDPAAREKMMRSMVTQIIAPSVTRNILVGGRPRFAPLAAKTIQLKMERGQPLKPGIATGHMLQSLVPGASDNVTRVTPDSLEYGTTAEGAANFHQGLASNHQPARPFMMLQSEDRPAMKARYQAWLLTGEA